MRKNADAEDVAVWLGPEHPFSSQATYALRGDQISFTMVLVRKQPRLA